MTAIVQTAQRRWTDLGGRARGLLVVGLPTALYLALYALPGSGDWLADKAPLGIVAIGVIIGSVTALMAIGLILIYRANRFINFAYGSMGSLAGVLAIALHLRHGWSYFIVLPLGVLGGVVLGGLLDVLVIRRFQNASRLILTVATIGLAQVLGFLELEGAKKLDFISVQGNFDIPLTFDVDLGVRLMRSDEAVIILSVPIVIALLSWFLLRTDAGVAVRAAAENGERAQLYGIPIRRLSTIVWMIAGGLSTLALILKAPSSGITPGIANGPTILIPALAAAVIARMESLPIAFAAGAGLGVVDQVVRWNNPNRPSVVDVILLGVILLALLIQRGKLSRAMEGVTSSWSSTGIIKPIPRELRHLPEVRWVRAGLMAVVALAFVLIPATWGPSKQGLAAVAIVWAMAGVSLVVLTGWGGNVSLGQFALVGVGAMVSGNLVTRSNTDLFLSLAAAGAAGAVVALIVGLPALRIRGLFLAATTLALAIAVNSYFINVNNFPDWVPQDVERQFLWERFDLNDNYNMYLLCLALLALSMLAAVGVRKARSGRVVIATRDNQRAADSASVPTTNVKLSAFALAGLIAGVAGGLYVELVGGLKVGDFNAIRSLEVFSTAVIGGLGSLGGAVGGVLLFRWLETQVWLGEFRLAVTGTGLLLVLYFLPGGLWQLVMNVRDRLLRRVADRRGIVVPSLVADKREVAPEDEHAPQEVELLRGALSGAGAGR
jgi:branched-chain amino acid transport system permease protein